MKTGRGEAFEWIERADAIAERAAIRLVKAQTEHERTQLATVERVAYNSAREVERALLGGKELIP